MTYISAEIRRLVAERLLEREALVSIGAYPAPSPTKQKH